ncbi:predicted protein [Naegleria gruberi]|uniref:Predicted protein n=1 Tax=Naegleria gruberi TaxID=5762 RepID=D2W0D2_NAEGR|nr:uncharacterized protein NAEGRDRAFT_53698 [Naegleria gruberi]EFC37411.1 predicted protein [Naegleria gruberi]|eukprot:XP_002670155.1 predicted protein [Naegleria gruberi strain NEG-M]
MQKRGEHKVLESEIESVLNNKETLKVLLDFARRSFCPEGILFYKDVQHYKKLVIKYQDHEFNTAFHNTETIKKHRSNVQKLVSNIVKSYLAEGSVNELNLPNVKILRNDINAKLAELEHNHSPYPVDLFDSAQVETLLTILGLYERLKYSNKSILDYSTHWRSKTTPHI